MSILVDNQETVKAHVRVLHRLQFVINPEVFVSFSRAEAVEREVALAGVAWEDCGKTGGDFERRAHRPGV